MAAPKLINCRQQSKKPQEGQCDLELFARIEAGVCLSCRETSRGQLGPVGDADRAVDLVQVNLYGAFRQPKEMGYLPVDGFDFEHRNDLVLAWGQSAIEPEVYRPYDAPEG